MCTECICTYTNMCTEYDVWTNFFQRIFLRKICIYVYMNAIRELRMLDPRDKPPPKRARRPTRGMNTENLCEVTRESNMICPITCGCHNSLLGIGEKTRIVSQILWSTRKIWKNELIAIFGLTPVAGPIFETKNWAIFLERFFGRGITAREQLSRAVILARF